MPRTITHRAVLPLAVALVIAAAPVAAQPATQDTAGIQARLDALQESVEALQRQIAELRADLIGAADDRTVDSAPPAATPSLVRTLDDPFVDESALPPLSFTCPMHPEIHETHDTPCPICGMNLVETRRAEAWTCPVHSVILETEGGVCPIDGRALIPIKLELTWTCPDHPHVASLGPGVCPIDGGQPLVQRLTSLPHEDHTPKHGGTFFMAPDNWHHVEGTYPETGRFVLHLYDNYSQPMPAGVTKGRAVLRETYDVATDQMLELVAYPLLASRDGTFLEAYIGSQDLPTEISAKIRFEPGGPEERFDFIFGDVTVDPAIVTGTPAAPTTTSATGLAPAPVAAAATTGTLTVDIPDAPGAIAVQIATRDERIQSLVRDGAFTEIWIPALEAKDLALALTPHLADLSAVQQLPVRLAVKELVRAAWLLDWYGDLGNRQRVEDAYAVFGQAAADIATAYEAP